MGGKKGKEIYHALVPLITAAAHKQHIVSLDFSLAFDFASPRLATWLFDQLHMPPALCRILHTQRRILSYEGCCLPEPEQVTNALPQGGPFSLLAMSALLMPPIWNIARAHPQVVQRVFVDDRAWAATSAIEAIAVENLWAQWSNRLQLRENVDKSQYYHATIAGRRQLVSQGAAAPNVTDQLCLLGHVLRGAQLRSLCAKELGRINKTLTLIHRTAFLPLPLSAKRAVIAGGPLAVGEFGWAMRCPSLKICSKVQIAIRVCRNASVPAWQRIGLAGVINALLTRMSWHRTDFWCWRHHGTDESLSLDPNNAHFIHSTDRLNHILREGFRAHAFNTWK